MQIKNFLAPLALCGLFASGTAQAISGDNQDFTISYKAVDIADQFGKDLWHYEYTISDFDTDWDYFYIPFSASDYNNIFSVSDPDGWKIDATSPKAFGTFVIPGSYQASYLEGNAHESESFITQFEWLGDDVPGPQTWQVYKGGNIITSGTTQLSTPVAAVPEASTYALMLGGLGIVGFMTRRRKNAA